MARKASSQGLAVVVLIGCIGCASSGGTPPAATQGTADNVAPAEPAAAATAAPAPAQAAQPEPAAPAITPVDPATAPQHVAVPVPKELQALLDAKDRTDADRALDAGRHPGEMLAFYGVKPGMKVAEIFAGSGYTAELLARAVGKTGAVYAVNNKFALEKFAAKPWGERLARPAMKNVVRVDREFDDPLPPEAKDLDAVFSVLVYHDLFWLKTDRDKMNAAIFKALKPGGVYAVIDHSGRTGTGSSEVLTLHRIEQSIVRAEIERAGFTLASEGGFLRNPQDTRDWNDSPKAAADRRGTSDRFAMLFVKPR
jgi:predicted methyltransferase